MLDPDTNTHRFEVKLDCPPGEDCKELVKRHLGPLQDGGVKVTVEDIGKSHDDL